MNTPFSIVTIVKGRIRQLSNLINSLEHSEHLPEELIIVWMAPPCSESLLSSDKFEIRHRFATCDELPIAKARNKGFRACTTPITLYMDVDCICPPDLLGKVCHSVKDGKIVTAGVTEFEYVLDDVNMKMLAQLSQQHGLAGRPLHFDHFDTRFFAITRNDYQALGGFDQHYTGYGIGDIDFATTCSKQGMALVRIAGTVFTQFHPHYYPPVNHLCDIVSNAQTYRQKWGVYPRCDALQGLVDAGFLNADYRQKGIKVNTVPDEDDLKHHLVTAPPRLMQSA
ncbi:glycosyltransferase [Alteromonas sp. C1M14]|uniref:glycosyltransferase family 2 protein n=1 Tax=Alteromonas sp. C1M14 TaxID=2841567 RepID=UPI001C09A200|nr:glycosyltransferase [Alteromonas sp. C1M14]MBU2978617.1 glycosyltransferase [Alteromonas sp. C1M14]